MIHELKIKPQYYEDVKIGLKPFEIRKNDRDFKFGDILILNEYSLDDSGAGTYSGRALTVRVTYLLNDQEYCKEGYVILGIITVGERHG
ncbi:MAG: DUF3850 domain-containing protein [Eubacterium sp.]|nr:DUF3850 domain-containing protein [Eubacterium sp.]